MNDPVSPALSIIIPLRNEQDNIAPLVAEIEQALKDGPDFEMICVNDGSTDKTADILETLRPRIRIFHHAVSCGQSAALRTGIERAAAPLILTLDGDGQNDPADIPLLLTIYNDHHEAGRDVMVMGERARRRDSLGKKLTSRFGNMIRQALLKDGVRDTGCSLKLFRRSDFLMLPYFDHMHRFLPALMKRENIATITTPVRHRPRAAGQSNYGFWDRFRVSVADMAGVLWLMRRRRRPDMRYEV